MIPVIAVIMKIYGQVSLTVSGVGDASFIMKGRIKHNEFKAMIDSGSSVTTLATKDLKNIHRTDVLFAQPLLHSEKM